MCLKGRFCDEGTAWNLDGCKGDYSQRIVSVADPSDLLPLKSNDIKNRALALTKGSSKEWTIKGISQDLACNQEHARRTLPLLLTEDKVSRRKLPSTGGRPVYANTEQDSSCIPNSRDKYIGSY